MGHNGRDERDQRIGAAARGSGARVGRRLDGALNVARGWLRLYALSVSLGVRHLLRHGWLREALIRILVPLDPSRYLEFPETLRELAARPGERVFDLASPKLVAVSLARSGVDVTSLDQLESEIENWRQLTADQPRLRLMAGDGRNLPFAEGEFDHAYSISVLEHIPDDGDEVALRELARVVRPGGRIVLTLPYATGYSEDWRAGPVYVGQEAQSESHFFGRWYDDARIERLVEAASPQLEVAGKRLARLEPMAVNHLYERWFPWLIPLGPLFGLMVHERDGPGGDMMRLTLVRRA